MIVDTDLVEGLLARDGWPFERVGEAIWRSGFRGETATFRFFVRLTDRFVSFLIVPFLPRPAGPDRQAKLNERLLRLNRDILMARFSLDEDGDVVLAVHYPTQALDESEFKDCLDVLSYYADRHYAGLLSIVK